MECRGSISLLRGECPCLIQTMKLQILCLYMWMDISFVPLFLWIGFGAQNLQDDVNRERQQLHTDRRNV